MTSEVPCPHDECERDGFDSEHAMKIHHYQAHGESLVERCECEYCGDEFRPRVAGEGVYCSAECFAADRRDRVELTCEECGEPFEVQRNEGDRRQYCSMDCYASASSEKIHRECACGHSFTTTPSMDAKYCTKHCRDEASCDRPRPDDLEMLLWLLYEYEDHTIKATHRRANIVLDREEPITRSDISEQLIDMGIHGSTAVAVKHKVRNGTIAGESGDTPDGDDSWKRVHDRSEADA